MIGVGAGVGAKVGAKVGARVGAEVGAEVGAAVHGVRKQVRVWVLELHFAPPFSAAMSVRVFICVPWPHVAVQVL